LLGGGSLSLISFFEPAFSTPEANGYFKQAKLISNPNRDQGGITNIVFYHDRNDFFATSVSQCPEHVFEFFISGFQNIQDISYKL
jgi:hypothetical protein